MDIQHLVRCNGRYLWHDGRGIELDDGYRKGSVHRGVAVVPSLVALALKSSREGRPICGSELLAAHVVGYEVVRVKAEAAQPTLRQHGG